MGRGYGSSRGTAGAAGATHHQDPNGRPGPPLMGATAPPGADSPEDRADLLERRPEPSPAAAFEEVPAPDPLRGRSRQGAAVPNPGRGARIRRSQVDVDGAGRVIDVFDSLGNFTRRITGASPEAPFTGPRRSCLPAHLAGAARGVGRCPCHVISEGSSPLSRRRWSDERS
jgi:hypothetical protein